MSDAELLKGGAKYVFDEEGEKVLAPIKEQIEKIHQKLEKDLSINDNIEKIEEKADFVYDAIRSKELFYESEDNKQKFDKFFSDMNERLLRTDKLVSDLKDGEIRDKFEKKINAFKGLLEDDNLRRRIERGRRGSDYCCLNDLDIKQTDQDYRDLIKLVERGEGDDARKNFLADCDDAGAVFYKKSEAGNDLGKALNRIALEFFKIANQARSDEKPGEKPGEKHDAYHFLYTIDQIAKELGVSLKEATYGVTNIMKTQKINYNKEKGFTIEEE